MKKSKKRAKKSKPSPRQRIITVIRKMGHFRRNIMDDLKERFHKETRSLIEDFKEGNISLPQFEEKANDLIKKYPYRPYDPSRSRDME